MCGLTRTSDISLAVELGADLVGFVLAPSPRQVSFERLPELVCPIPASVITVAVVVDSTQEQVDSLLEVVDRVQFHGSESPEFCARYRRRGIKAFRIRQASDLNDLKAYEGKVGAFLLDAFKQGMAGGTGHTFPWEYLRGAELDTPTFLAGGLNPDNVTEALRVGEVAGLDVSSGLEHRPGEKDPKLVRQFFSRIVRR